ncbi:acyltransferase domain-containing protein [Streptomyces solisilvae]|uniref:acyltransferase domain-containing protein n=1 Tax=Streptomyces malaysiensis TaxID=92644 RepID=UPI003690F8B9
MATSLRDRVPMFAVAFQKIAAELDPLLDQPLAEILRDGPGERTDHAQAAVFAVQVAVFRLLTTLGVRPDAVAGHSVGELAAAHAAGVFSLADTCALVAARGRLMRELGGEGAMVAVQVPEADVPELLRGHEERVAPAAVNGPASVVLAGDADALAAGDPRCTAWRCGTRFTPTTWTRFWAPSGRCWPDWTSGHR